MSSGYVLHGGYLLSAAAPASVTALLSMEIKKNGGFNFLKPPQEIILCMEKGLPSSVFFFSAAGQMLFKWILSRNIVSDSGKGKPQIQRT